MFRSTQQFFREAFLPVLRVQVECGLVLLG